MRDQPELERLLSITDVDTFHTQFETYFSISPRHRLAFGEDALLQPLRIAYLFEVYASTTEHVHEKILYQYDALNLLLSLNTQTMTQVQFLFLCHYTAKIHYELGVIWMELHHMHSQEIDLASILNPSVVLSESHQAVVSAILSENKDLLRLAVQAFEQASACYESFKIKYAFIDNDAFYEPSYDLYRSFKAFDAYSPWARMISIACNHYLCVQEDEQSTLSNTKLLADLNAQLEKHKETAGSRSFDAICVVKTILNPLPLAMPHANTAHPNKKRKKKGSDVAVSSVIDDWLPVIAHRDDFNRTLQENRWSTPLFLRTRQQQDLQQIYMGFKTFNQPLVVTKPTGTGKTAELSAITNAAWQNHVVTVIVVPTVTLAEQTRNKLIEYSHHHGMDYNTDHITLFCPTLKSMRTGPITVVTQSSYVKQVMAAQERFPSEAALQAYVTTTENAYLEKEVFFHPSFFSLLIIDEGHHVVGEKMYDCIKSTPCRRPIVLLSASTLPEEYPAIDDICQHVVTQTLHEAIDNGELASIQALTIDFSMYEKAKQLTRSIRTRMPGKIKELDAQSRQDISDLMCEEAGFSLTAISILKQVKDTIPSAKKMMVFTDSIDHANLLATMLTQLFHQNIQAFHTKSPHREKVLDAFKKNKTQVIVAVGALDEGFDDPNVNVILDFSIYVTRIRRIIQRLGRSLRLRDDGSGAILISIKLLPQDLQLIPRDVIMGRQEHGYLGVSGHAILNDQIIKLVLPNPLTISSSQESSQSESSSGYLSNRTIYPQGAAMVFPRGRARFKLGTPPQDHEADESQSSASMQALDLVPIPPMQHAGGAMRFFNDGNAHAATDTFFSGNNIPSFDDDLWLSEADFEAFFASEFGDGDRLQSPHSP